ncbi:AraC family transcriptional regulator [Streptomyces sp. Wh19]|uniref:AraC family transcriptional regulator n=1 Tax=Streptomyces sp. Wh19 TaxID=3076629 RepID=UPI0029586B35|nr:AraC family transcriptional regulator [Streptomyces sp. Wh19]MDV9195871.1 AraC family transcriptional regulator [Streptomyces sp. Wh19]
MDTLANLLSGVQARGAVFTRTVMSPQWSLRFASGAQLTLVTMLNGSVWITPANGEPTAVGPGDIAVLRGPAPYTVGDDPASPPQQVVTSADYCARTARAVTDGELTLGVRTCGVAEAGSALLVSGAYAGPTEISDRLLDALPDVLIVPDGECDRALLTLVAKEVQRDKNGQQAVLDRLLDLLLVATLRVWLDRPQSPAPAWHRPADSVVVSAIRLMHDRPAHPWTVATLAAKVGSSRSGLARRFTQHVGEPPMTYLAARRVGLAAELLHETDATVGSVARKVGYSNAFALSVAFKRYHGITPTEHRAAALRTRGASS